MTLLAEVAAPASTESWHAVAVSLIVTIGGLIGIYLKQRSTDGKVGQVQEQVANNHDTNLRDDLTAVKGSSERMLGIVEEGIRKLYDEHIPQINQNIGAINTDLGRIRDEISGEREARRTEVAEVRAELRKLSAQGEGDSGGERPTV